jgi:hypothetical protein
MLDPCAGGSGLSPGGPERQPPSRCWKRFSRSTPSADPNSLRVCWGGKVWDDHCVRAVEQACRAELRDLPPPVRSGALAAAVLELAKRLDGDPADTTAALIVRELRLALAELHRRAGDDVGGEAERFLEQIANPAFRNPGD